MRSDDSVLRFDIVPYFHGKILDVSECSSRAYPHFISHIDLRIDEPDKCGMFADRALDGVLSSGLLDKLSDSERGRAIAEWCRITRDGGHIMLHAPKVPYLEAVALIEKTGRGFDLVQCGEYPDGALYVFRMAKDGKAFSHALPRPEKTCAVVRLGAFGDCIQASSILPWLRASGYHITFYCSDYGYPVLQHDPHIDRFIIQGRDEMPPAALGRFWDHEKQKYDRWINLSESVEATLLSAPGSSSYEWPNEVRAKYMDRNYLEFTHDIAGVPPPYLPVFHATTEEKLWAREKARSYGKRNILWSLSGSAVHKTWPHLDSVVAAVLLAYPDVDIVMVGDDISQILEAGWEKERRVHKMCGDWTIRQSMAFAQVADLVVGTETGLLNAVGMMDTPKVIALSHSSPEMLTKHWPNTIALTQPEGVGCRKYPCRQMHHDWSACFRHETGAALCMASIPPTEFLKAIAQFLGEPTSKEWGIAA